MATNIITSPGAFDVQGPEPLDLRIVQPTLQDMYNIPVPKRHLGLTVYVAATQKHYILRNGLGSYGVSDDWEDLLPYASVGIAGLVKVGTNLSIDENGVLHATGGVGGELTDGDKGDIIVSAGGSVWTIDDGVIGTAKLGVDITTAGKALLDDVDAAAQRITLGLGDLATSTGTWVDGSYVSGSNTGDQDAENIDSLLSGITPLHTHVQYAPLDNPTFTGIVSLPETTSIGNLSAQEIDWLSDITSSLQTQLNNRMQIDVLYNGDLDSISVTGDYRIATGATNCPSGAGINGSKLIHTNWNANLARQVYYDYASDRIFTRRKVNTWQIWNELVLATGTAESTSTTYTLANEGYFDVPAGQIIETIVLETVDATGGSFTLGLTAGIREVGQLVITHAATSSGNVSVIIDGYSMLIGVTAGMSAVDVATQIRSTWFGSYATTSGSGTTVIFTAVYTGTKVDLAFSGGTTGVTATASTSVQGAFVPGDIVASISIGTAVGVLKYLTIIRPDTSMSTTVAKRMYVGLTTNASVRLRVTTRYF